MKFYFTTTKHLYSRLIRWGLKEDCSHFAVQIEFPNRDVVIESHIGSGVVIRSSKEFLKENRVIHCLSVIDSDIELENDFYTSMYRMFRRRYDTWAIAFWALAAICKRAFGAKLPRDNPWGRRGDHYCVEVLDGSQPLLLKHLGIDASGVEFDMMSPHMAYEFLRKSDRLRDVTIERKRK